jgi:hypothetical protein
MLIVFFANGKKRWSSYLTTLNNLDTGFLNVRNSTGHLKGDTTCLKVAAYSTD